MVLAFLGATAAMLLVALVAPHAMAADTTEKALAYVGGDPVTDVDLERLRSGALAGREEPELLEYAVRRKVLVQRALKDGMFKDPAYREALQRAREDALIRTLIEKKTAEISAGITVTDEELAIFARRMCYTVGFLRSEFGEARDAEKFVAQGKAGKARKWEDEVTAAGCEGLGPLMMDTVFSLEPGEEKVIARGRRFSVIRLEEKRKTTDETRLPDIEKIRAYLIEKKAAEALDDWLDKVVDEARVRYVGRD